MVLLPPWSTRTDPLFPSTTLSRPLPRRLLRRLRKPEDRGRRGSRLGGAHPAVPPRHRAAPRLLDPAGRLPRAARDGGGGGAARGLGGGARTVGDRPAAGGLLGPAHLADSAHLPGVAGDTGGRGRARDPGARPLRLGRHSLGPAVLSLGSLGGQAL